MSQTIATPPSIHLGTEYIGQPVSRVDGPAKVTGAAKYAAEFNVPDLLYGVVVNSPITKGRITKINAAPVLVLPGLLTGDPATWVLRTALVVSPIVAATDSHEQ